MGQRLHRTDRLFFDYCLTHGRHAYEQESPVPAILPRTAAREMVRSAHLIYRALQRCSGTWIVPPFPMRDQIVELDMPPVQPFWARFDGFLRDKGGIFFAELNVDRPGGHREAMAAPRFGGRFRRRFLAALKRTWQRWAPSPDQAPRMAFLVDPAHREELHIAHFYAGLAAELGWPCIVVGPLNLSADEHGAYAFGEPIDLLMRQFPTEFGHEVPAFGELIRLHRQGSLLLLNDPAAVRGQAKSCFAWLWEQVLAGGGALTPSEVQAVRTAVPYTSVMTEVALPADPADPTGARTAAPLALLEWPERWVLKPVLGRYSQGVTSGAIVPADVWGAAVAAALAEPAYWIAQQYVAIASQSLVRGSGKTVTGYVNWGLHFIAGHPAGWMARCSETPLTDDAWFAEVDPTGESADGTEETHP